MLSALFGGVSFSQIGRVYAVTVASVLVCGSLGSTLALWREKTYQSLAMTMLVLVLWLAAWRIVATGLFGTAWWGISCETWAAGFSPWEAVLEATQPYLQADPALGPLATPVNLFLVVAGGLAVLLNGVAIAMVRVWNPSRQAQSFRGEDETWQRASIWGAEYDAAQEAQQTQGSGFRVQGSGLGGPSAIAENRAATRGNIPAAAPAAAKPRPPARSREVWDNPIIWREVATWAYGRKILVIRLAYLLLFALAAGSLGWMVAGGQTITGTAGAIVLPLLFVLSLVLINAQAVTALTSERDAKALDLLLVSDLTPKEIVFGKLGGVLYNTKEMVVLPILLCGYLCYAGAIGVENTLYLVGGLLVLDGFVAMLGVHAGMNYANSFTAIATSLGTVFFLFLGVRTCMEIMIRFSGSFEAQLQPFLAFMVGGGVGLYVALGARNPSTAIAVASFLCPFATFYAITSLLLNQTLGVFLVIAAAYGFTTAAMLIPAIYEFDVATGRTTIEEQ
jgi:hypothetical protein